MSIVAPDFNKVIGVGGMRGYEKFLRNSRPDVVKGLVKEKARIEVDQAIQMEKSHQYQKQAMLNVRREKARLGKHTVNGLGELKSVTNANTWFRHNMCRPGSMLDKGYKKEFLRDNPDCKVT